jgi:hypothetical protein
MPPVLHHAFLVHRHDISPFLPCNHELPQPRRCLAVDNHSQCRRTHSDRSSLVVSSSDGGHHAVSVLRSVRLLRSAWVGLFCSTLLSSVAGLHAKIVLAMTDANLAVLLLRCDELIALCAFLRPDEECMHYSHPMQALRPRASRASRSVHRSCLSSLSVCRPRWSRGRFRAARSVLNR